MGKPAAKPPPPEAFKVNPFAALKAASLPANPNPNPAPAAKPPAKAAGEVPATDPALKLELLGGARPERHPVIRLRRVKKGRGGKEVTVIGGFEADVLSELMALLAQLKRDLGAGGLIAERSLELQGDQRTRAAAWFAARGFRTAID
ncbi:MAG: translation initiation factor [Lentisphaeria bacterium]|jgi:translation initiation factor 1